MSEQPETIAADPDDIREQVALMAEKWRGVRCGGASGFDTPDALYRAVFLFHPTSVDFSDMYKTFLFGVMSPDGRFAATVELFKYELGLYFYCRDKQDVGGAPSAVVAGHPGADNGVSCKEAEGLKFFSMLEGALRSAHGVYGGNDFVV